MLKKFRIASASLVAAMVGASLVSITEPASAVQTAQPTVVSSVAATNTPDVNDGTVYSIGSVGTRMYLGGNFTSVSPHATPGTTYTRNNILAFNTTTGAIDTGFVPTINGEVDSIIPGPAAGQVYVAGSFNTVNGTAMRVALLNATTGALVSTWKPSAMNSATSKLVLADGMLFVAGNFTTVGGITHDGLVALNPQTGKVLPYVGLNFTGHHNYGVTCDPTVSSCANGAVGVGSIDVNPAGTQMVAIGNFTDVSGNARDQIAVINLGSSAATINASWATSAYTAACFSGAFDSYIRDVQFSPDGSYFVVVATGGSGTNTDGSNSSCDSAARYEANGTGTDVRPTWIDYTGQDSLWTVAISGTAVYVGGHERWLNNSKGYDYAGPGAVPRPGIAALSPVSGVPLAWNPGRNPRGGGLRAFLLTSTGLWIGSDTDYIGNFQYLHRKVAFFPLAGGETLPTDTTPTLPGRVYTAGSIPSSTNSNVLYRINAGGPTVGAVDNGPDWQGDTSDPSPYRNSGSNTAGYGPITTVDSTVPSSTPLAIFNSERWDPGSNGDGNEMHWAFPVPAGEKVDVRLYFANRCSCTSATGQRQFDVAIDGQTFLSDFDIVQAAGDQTGTMRDEVVTSDGEVDIDLSHEVENPLINGIEIVEQSAPTTFPNAIYRVNAGGEKIAPIDGSAAAWQADNTTTVGNGTAFRSGQTNSAFWGEPWGGTLSSSVDGTSVPANVFGSEAWDPSSDDTNGMQYSFPVSPGTPVALKLFFANNCSCTSSAGQRIFNVTVDGQPVPALTNYDIVGDVGDQTAVMKTVNVTAPASGMVTVNFAHAGADNPLINAVEVDQTGPTPTTTASNIDRFSYRHFDGTTAGTEQTLSTGIAWGSIRGAFTVNGEIVYGKADGNLYERTYNGTTFGSEVLLDPYDDPFWDSLQTGSGQTYQGQKSDMSAEMSSVTSMFFSAGRLFYTLRGDSVMHWRWFEPESGIIGSSEFSTTDGNDWSNVAGAFLSGSTLYFADRTTSALSSIAWNGNQATGAATVVNTSQNWASRGIFMLADATNPNQAPVASYTSTCSTTNTSCTFDASASSDPDGSITDFAWSFNGGATEHHVDATPFSHDFSTPGKYSVSLTVTDNDGATTTKTTQITVGQTVATPKFVNSTTACGPGTGTCGSSPLTNVAVPPGTVAGDALLMFVSWPSSGTVTSSVPSGWHLLGTNVSSQLESDVYYRAATAGDLGGTIPVTFSAKTHNAVTLADYSGTDPSSIEAFAKSFDSNTASHTTPNATVSVDGSLAVSYWADKSATTSTWTPPASVTARSVFIDSGTSFTTSLLADSNTTVASGTYGSKTATTNAASGKGAEWTIILGPAGSTPPPANVAPTAAFTTNCTNLSCSFNASTSSDSDGTVVSYAWNFGDGTTQPASASQTATHAFASASTYPVLLTVTDNGGATGTTTTPVAVTTAAPKSIAFVGSNTFDGTGTSGTVTVPAAAAAGDTLLLFESHASSTITASAPAGWTVVGSTSTNNLQSTVYEKTATATDGGKQVSVPWSASVKGEVTVADYSGTAASPIEAQSSSTAINTTSHATPTLTGLASGSWVVSFWTDKSTTTAHWTAPATVTQRAVVYGAGGGAVSGLLADSGAAVSGTYAAKTATTDVSSGSAAQWSIALSPSM